MDENNRDLNTENIDEEIKDELSYDNEEFRGENIKIEEDSKKTNIVKEVYEWISSIALAVVLAFLINTFLFSLVQVDGSSMVPTLHHAERLIVRKIAYTPENSDVVIVKSKPLQKFIVKRVVATPKQSVGFDSELNLVVDGKKLEENYIESKQVSIGYLYNYPVTIPKKGDVADIEVLFAEQANMPNKVLIEQKDGKIFVSGSSFVADGEFIIGTTTYTQDGYFVLGDNRNNSADSRVFGIVPQEEIIGEAIFRFYPFNVIGTIK